MILLQPVVPAPPTDLTTPLTNLPLQYGAIGTLCFFLIIAIIFLVRRIGKLEDQLAASQREYTALQEKRHDDHKLVAEKHITVLADNARTIETLATSSEKHTTSLNDLVVSHERVVTVVEELRKLIDTPRGRGR